MMMLWDRLERWTIGLLGIAALCVGTWQVVGRYCFPQLSSGWGDEVVVYLIIWAIMIVSSQLVRHDGHVRPDLVLRLMSPGVQRWFEAFNCVVALGFCALLVWYGWEIVDTSQMLDERSSTGLEFPMWIYDLSLPAGSALMFLRYVFRLVRYVFYFNPNTMTVGHLIVDAPAGLDSPGLQLPPGH